MRTITCITREGESYEAEIDKFPDICPICHNGALFKRIFAHGDPNMLMMHSPWVEVAFLCPVEKCDGLFLALYVNPHPRQNDTLYLDATFRMFSIDPVPFPEPIPSISKKFQMIYDQSLQAEKNGLGEIAGPGYRKALEFLVKDYMCKEYPDKAEEYKAKFLGNVIDEIADEDIRELSKRAAWLGNDHSHYVREFEEYDLKVLKALIELVVNRIVGIERRKELTEGIQHKRSKAKES